jgi:hypothetical protein
MKAFFIVFLLLIIFACNSGDRSSVSNVPQKVLLNFADTLDPYDSIAIEQCKKASLSSDTVYSETNCSSISKFYDVKRRVRIRQNKQYCMADRRMVWEWRTYFDTTGAVVCSLGFDGNGNLKKHEKGIPDN